MMDIAETIVRKNYKLGKTFFESDEYGKHYQKLREQYRYICIYGAGVLGTTFCRWMKDKGIEVDFICDENPLKVGNTLLDIPIISYEELCNYNEDDVYIIVTVTNKGEGKCYNNEIVRGLNRYKNIESNLSRFMAYYTNDYVLTEEECVEAACVSYSHLCDDFSKELYLKLLELKFIHSSSAFDFFPLERFYDPAQYFSESVYINDAKEIVVDCGAYKGDTLKEFLKRKFEFSEYHCFEMDKKALKELNIYIDYLDEEIKKKIIVHPQGVYSSRRNAFATMGTENLSSKISGEDRGEPVELISLDEALVNGKVTYINMDVEGSELEALKGAKQLIKKYKPKLAISIYHSTEQFFEVPRYIIREFPFYKLKLRQHTTITDDTVLYAVI